MPPNTISYEAVERAARLYHRNIDAARALGITAQSFTQACQRNGLETPTQRQRRQRRAAASRAAGEA